MISFARVNAVILFSAKVNHLIKCVFYTNTPLKRPKQETIRIFVINCMPCCNFAVNIGFLAANEDRNTVKLQSRFSPIRLWPRCTTFVPNGSIAAKIQTKMSEDRTKVWTVMLWDQFKMVTESWKKIWAERGEKSWQKFWKKMREKWMRCCKNYPQTGRIIQPQFVEIKPAKTCRKHKKTVTYYSLITGKKQTKLRKQARMSENRTK